MFDEIRLEFAGVTICTVHNPGFVPTITMDRNEFLNATKYAWFIDDSVKMAKKKHMSSCYTNEKSHGIF